MVLLLHICRNSVSWSKTSEVAHGYGLHLYSMYSVTECEDINGTAKFYVPLAVNLEQFASNSAEQQFASESVQLTAKDVSLRS